MAFTIEQPNPNRFINIIL